MARDSLFPPRTPENRSFERARLGALRPSTDEEKGLSPETQAVAAEVCLSSNEPMSQAEYGKFSTEVQVHRAETRDEVRARLKIVPSDCQGENN